MKSYILLLFSILSLVLVNPGWAQNKKDHSNNYKYYKALELLDSDGDMKEVRRLVEENIKENPMHVLSYELLVKIEVYEENYGAAIKGVEKALKVNHKNSGVSDAHLLWYKVLVYDRMGELGKAITLMESVLKMAKKNKDNLTYMTGHLADLYSRNKRYDESDKLFMDVLSKDETNQDAMIGMASNMNARGEYDKALAILDECMKFNANYANIYKARKSAYEGKKEYKKMIDAMVTLYDKSGNTDYLIVRDFNKDKHYSEAVLKGKIAQKSDNVMWRVVLSEFYKVNYRHKDELSLLNGLISEYGNEPELLESRAECQLQLGMTEQAIEDITKSIELSVSTTAPYYYGARSDIYRRAGKYNEAIADLDIYIKSFPTSVSAYYLRGWCRELSGDDKGAMDDYNAGIAINDDYAYIFLMRGERYLKLGNDYLARKDFERVVEIDTVVDAYSCRHYALHFLGHDDQALEWMDKIIGEDENDYGNWYDKSCLLARMGRLEESVKALETAFVKGYRCFAHIENDDDMDPIRDRGDFQLLVDKYKQLNMQEIKQLMSMGECKATIMSEVEMKKMYSGTYEVECHVNSLPLKMIFDTGASSMTISSVEANFMFKNGYLSRDDVKGSNKFMTASGDVYEGTVIRLKEVRLGDAVLKNIEASVVHNQKAPLLLGQSVLDKFGAITIDYENSKLIIKQ